MGVDAFGLSMGLGFVLSFGYWCTDFLVVQRAMAAESMTAARRTPLIAAFPKMVFPFLVIMPGLIALVVHPSANAPADLDRAVLDSRASFRRGLIPYKFDEAAARWCATMRAGRCSTSISRFRCCCCATSRPACSGWA